MSRTFELALAAGALSLLVAPGMAFAQAPAPDAPAPIAPAPIAPAPIAPAPVPAAEAAAAPPPSGPTVKVDGYVEVDFSHNFNQPSNGITNFRGYDNRSDTFTLSNAVLGAKGEWDAFSARIALQVGHTPTTYSLAEPVSPGAGGAATTTAEVFKYVQEAHVDWKAPLGRGLTIAAGVFLSPVGYEGIAVKDNWTWSRSNLFFGLPAYHTGLKVSYDFTDRFSAMLLGSNGWNSVVDNNDGKSVTAQLVYKIPDRLTVSLLYFGGNERPKGAPEGEPWRHTFDLWAQLDATSWLSFAAHGDAGFERTEFGTSYWGAGALYARVHPVDWLYLAARGDSFWEHAASNADGAASPIFWPADNVTSGTFTVDFRPHSNVSFRVEYRHDQASSDMFFAGQVAGDGITAPYLPNAEAQDTLTFGATGWF